MRKTGTETLQTKKKQDVVARGKKAMTRKKGTL